MIFHSSPETAPVNIVPELGTVSNLMFNFLVGSGVIVHPSDDGHSTIADVIIDETAETIFLYINIPPVKLSIIITYLIYVFKRKTGK